MNGSTLYRQLETTRTFALAKLAERTEENLVARRHAKFFSEFLQYNEVVQSKFGEHDLSGYGTHIGNVRAALQWAFSEDGDVSVGVELATRAASLFIGLSLLVECDRWCERALVGLAEDTRGTGQEMILQEALALSSMYTTGNSDRVRAAIERGLALEEAFGDGRHRLALLFGMYRFLMRLADFRGALAVAQQGATFAEDDNDAGGQAIADFMLGTCYHFIGDQAVAEFYGERGIARAAELGAVIPNFFGFDHHVDTFGFARTLWLRGFSDRARRVAKSAIDEALTRAHPLSICGSLTYSSPVFLWNGDFPTVGDYSERLVEYPAEAAAEQSGTHHLLGRLLQRS